MSHSISNENLSILSAIKLPPFPENETKSHSFYNHILNRIANFLLYNTRLYLPTERTFKFLEIEFYLNDATNDHDDPYSHGHEHQLTCGEWYFHRVGKSGYRGGTRKGIDITFGSAERKIYGGILIRAIQDELTKEVTEGPSLVVDKIGLVYLIQVNNELTNIDDIVERDKKRLKYSTGLTSPYFDQKSSGTPLTRDNKISNKIYTSPRVGITLSNKMPSVDLRLQYLLKPYRFFTSPHLLDKGKAQLIIGLYDHFKQIDKVAKVAGISQSQVENYVQEMTNGIKNGDLNEFIGKKGKGIKGIEYCQMAGVVKKILG